MVCLFYFHECTWDIWNWMGSKNSWSWRASFIEGCLDFWPSLFKCQFQLFILQTNKIAPAEQLYSNASYCESRAGPQGEFMCSQVLTEQRWSKTGPWQVIHREWLLYQQENAQFFWIMSVIWAEDVFRVVYLLSKLMQFPSYLACLHVSWVACNSTGMDLRFQI